MDGEKGRGRRKPGPDEELSRALSKTLRHAAKQQGIPIDANGYCRVSDLLAHSRYQNLKATPARITHAVETNAKQRFEFDETGTKIRARQGHSISVDVALQPLSLDSLPPVIVHGTSLDAWKSIRTQGLKKMKRLHIHMAAGLPGEVVSGMRNSAQALIYIDGPAAMADGIEFLQSANGAILSEGKNGTIEPKYFLKVTDRNGTSLV